MFFICLLAEKASIPGFFQYKYKEQVSIMNEATGDQEKKELHAFLFLTAALASLMSAAIVGTYGVMTWLYELYTGSPVI